MISANSIPVSEIMFPVGKIGKKWIKIEQKLFQTTLQRSKVKSFVDQTEEQAKRKSEIIRKRPDVEEAGALNTVTEAKEQLGSNKGSTNAPKGIA